MNAILSADPVISATFSPNTDTCAKGRPILILWESDDRPEEPFGELTASTGTSYNPYRFTGQQWDQDSGLYYLRARYYDPSTGRFISMDYRDPNVYAYAVNNPINFVDPTGEVVGASVASLEILIVVGIVVTVVGITIFVDISKPKPKPDPPKPPDDGKDKCDKGYRHCLTMNDCAPEKNVVQKMEGAIICKEAYLICKVAGYNAAWKYAMDNGVKWPSYGGLP